MIWKSKHLHEAKHLKTLLVKKKKKINPLAARAKQPGL